MSENECIGPVKLPNGRLWGTSWQMQLFSEEFYKQSGTNLMVRAVITALEQGESPYKIIEDLCKIK